MSIRITTWNCARGKPEVKLPRLLATKPDILVVQESARPKSLAGKYIWHGDNPNQGLLALADEDFELVSVRLEPITAKFFLPLQVTGPSSFNLLGVWAKPATKHPIYVNSLLQGIEAYRRFIQSAPTIILGDFNTARYLSSGNSHMEFVNLLHNEYGLKSAYHEYYQEEQGYETHYTYFDRTKKGRPFHIDYCFIPLDWLPLLKKVAIGHPEQWSDLSDHTPITVELDL